MQVSVEESGALKRRLSVTIPGENIETEVARRLEGLGKRAKIKGFRPGKAPAKVVRQQYGAAVREDVLEELMRSHYANAVEQENLAPVGEPSFDDGKTANDGSYTFVAELEVYPQFDPQGVDELVLSRPRIEIADADVDEVMQRLRRQKGQWVEIERPAAAGDRVVLDFEGRIEGEPFEGNTEKDMALVLGSHETIPGFEEGLEGITAGAARVLDLEFPRDYRKQDLAGRPVRFEVTTHRIEALELPSLDDAFAVAYGVAEGGLARLRERVRENMTAEAEERIRAELLHGLSDQLVAANSIEVPTALIEDEIVRQKRIALRRFGIAPEERQLSSLPREPFADTANRRVRLGLILSRLIEREVFRPDPARVEKRIMEFTADAEDPVAEARKIRTDNGAMRQIEALVLEDMAYDWLLEQATITEEPTGFFEYMEPREGGATEQK
ncbi:MAG: trigger factor [Gammaproteobacteria bacterium]